MNEVRLDHISAAWQDRCKNHYEAVKDYLSEKIIHPDIIKFQIPIDSFQPIFQTEVFFELPNSLIQILHQFALLQVRQEIQGWEVERELIQLLISPLTSGEALKKWDTITLQAYVVILDEYFDSILIKNKNSDNKDLLYEYLIFLERLRKDLVKFSVDICNELYEEPIFIGHEELEEQIVEAKKNSYLSIWQLSSYRDSNQVKQQVAKDVISLYQQLEAIDSEKDNMFDCLGRINYHGSEHFYYQMMRDTLKSDIYERIKALPIQDFVILFDDIEQATEDFIMDIEDWQDFKNSLLGTDEIDNIIHEIQSIITRFAPDYNPYAAE